MRMGSDVSVKSLLEAEENFPFTSITDILLGLLKADLEFWVSV